MPLFLSIFCFPVSGICKPTCLNYELFYNAELGGTFDMVEKIAIRIVGRLKEECLINATDEEYYEYAVITIIERYITVITLLLLGMAYGQILPTVCFLCFFLSLRKRTGGYHADKFWKCYLGTAVTFIAVIEITKVLSEKPIIMYGLLLCSVILIEVIGTVNHPNMDMDVHELQESKKAARLVVLLEAMVIVSFIFLRIESVYIGYMSIAIILCAFLLCLAKMIKQEVRTI